MRLSCCESCFIKFVSCYIITSLLYPHAVVVLLYSDIVYTCSIHPYGAIYTLETMTFGNQTFLTNSLTFLGINYYLENTQDGVITNVISKTLETITNKIQIHNLYNHLNYLVVLKHKRPFKQ